MQKVRKVLMLVENIAVPADPRVWAEATSLHEAGYQVSVICPKGKATCLESYAYLDQIHIYRYRLPESHSKSLAYTAEYGIALVKTFLLSFKILRRHGFDVIHTANPPDIFFLIGLFYRCFGKKFVFDQHDLSPEMFQVLFEGRMKPLYKLLCLLERCSYRFAHVVITTNRSILRIAIERGHCAAQKVFVVRNGPDLKSFVPSKPGVELPLPQKRRYLLAYLGLMGKQDGVEYILYALHNLVYQRGRIDVSVVLIGDGSEMHELRDLVQQLKLDEYVFFTGWMEKRDALAYLAVADIGLSPDPQNGLNEFCTMLKTMEYMAMGLPIVSFDLAETRFSAQNAALYAKPNEVEDFACNIETLLDDEALRLHMGVYGKRRIVEVLSWEHSRKHLLAAYETLFSTKSAIQSDESVIDETNNGTATAGVNTLPGSILPDELVAHAENDNPATVNSTSAE